MTNTPWGYMHTLAAFGNLQGESVKVKILHLKPGERTSLQYHRNRCEMLIPLTGNMMIERTQGYLGTVRRYDTVHVTPWSIHAIWNDSKEDWLVVLEVQFGTETSEEDIVRLDDPHKDKR